MQIIVFEAEVWESEACSRLRAGHDLVCTPEPLSAANAASYESAEAITTFVNSRLDATVLAALPRLKLIATRSTGYDHIDLGFCARAGIAVANVPNYGDVTVAEHAFALLLGLTRNLLSTVEGMRSGRFDQSDPPGIDLYGKTMGVIGTGRIAGRGGVLVVPAFAVGRAQAIMLQIARLKSKDAIPDVPVYLNSPMATDATEIYHRYHDEHHVSDAECRAMFDVAQRVRTVEESKALNRRSGPFIVISASGMLTGGRVLHHVASFGPDARNAIVLMGFQAGGTRGAALVRGDKSLRIFGREVPIEAEVVQIESMSGHADANEIMGWLGDAPPPRMTYITHGEPASSDALRFRLEHDRGWNARVPEQLEKIDLLNPR